MSIASSAATKVETVIVGAGVIGLAVARALALANGGQGSSSSSSSRCSSGEILLLDRAATIGSETSSRNSEVVHAGLYYPEPSFKAHFCVRGKQQLYDYCEARHISHLKCGKLVVATEPEQVETTLAQLQRQAVRNGVIDTEILTRSQVLHLEPALAHSNLHGALWSPSTGILDSHSFLQHLLTDAVEQGDGRCCTTTLALHTKVEDAAIVDGRIHVYAGDMWLSCDRLVNCAGLWAGQIASLLHGKRNDIDDAASWKPPKQYFARGTYFRLQQQQQPRAFSHLIYPIPDSKGGLGVHATMDLQGQVKFGPDVEWLDADDPDTIDMKPDASRAELFYQSIRTYWPDLKDGALVPDYTGVRPKLQHPSLFPTGQSMPFQDFVVAGPETHGVAGLVHLFGIESPGLTSSMAIADYVAKLIANR